MPIVQAKCENCGGNLTVESSLKAANCPHCGAVPVPEDQLPVLLPDDVEWKPTGESPLKLHPTLS